MSVCISHPLQAQVDCSPGTSPESFLPGISRHLLPVLCSQCHKGSARSHCQCSSVTARGALNHTGRRGVSNAVNETTKSWASCMCQHLFLQPKPKSQIKSFKTIHGSCGRKANTSAHSGMTNSKYAYAISTSGLGANPGYVLS